LTMTGGRRSYPISFDYNIMHSNGYIKFTGESVGSYRGRKVAWLEYQTNITGEAHTFVDTAVALCQGKNSSELEQLTMEDIEIALLNKGAFSSFRASSALHRIFGFVGQLQQLVNPVKQSQSAAAYTFSEYEQNRGLGFDHTAHGPFSALALDEKFVVVNGVVDTYIRASLQADGGDLECIHIAEDLIVIRYLGKCGQCGQSLTSTMESITNILRDELNDNNLNVLADS